jgi:hypothetical protein
LSFLICLSLRCSRQVFCEVCKLLLLRGRHRALIRTLGTNSTLVEVRPKQGPFLVRLPSPGSSENPSLFPPKGQDSTVGRPNRGMSVSGSPEEVGKVVLWSGSAISKDRFWSDCIDGIVRNTSLFPPRGQESSIGRPNRGMSASISQEEVGKVVLMLG